jgi:hypothetical protein
MIDAFVCVETEMLQMGFDDLGVIIVDRAGLDYSLKRSASKGFQRNDKRQEAIKRIYLKGSVETRSGFEMKVLKFCNNC